MYDENGIIVHTESSISTATSVPDTSTNSIASSVLANYATASNSISPTASAASDCSYDSPGGDPYRIGSSLANPLLLFPSVPLTPSSSSFLPLLNLAQSGSVAVHRPNVSLSANALVSQQLRNTKIDPTMALINPSSMNVKDSRWLQVEVCREFQRGQCSRNEQECKFAHPPPHVEVQNGKVTACYDHLKSRCTRDSPKCKYLHAPQHLKDQLVLNGRNNLMMKNLASQLGVSATPILPNAAATAAAVAAANQFANLSPFATPVGGAGGALVPGGLGAYSPYAYALNTAAVYPGLMSAASQDAFGAYGGLLPTGAATSPVSVAAAAAVQQAQKAAIVRVDRVEVCREFSRGTCQRGENECKYAHPKADVERASDGTVVVCIDFVRKGGGDGACTHKPCRYYHPPPHLLQPLAARLLQQQPTIAQQAHMQSGSLHGANMINGGNASDASDQSSSTAALLLAYQQHLQQQLMAMQPLQSASTYAGYPTQMQHNSNASASAAAASSSALPASSANMQTAAAAQAYAASQLAAVAQQQATTSVAKKRPLEPDSVVQLTAHSASTDPLLLAAAAFQNAPVNKRAAMEKGGVPVYQQLTPGYAATVNALQYPQFAATFPGFQTSYVPLTFTAATAGTHAPALPSAAAAALPNGEALLAAALQHQQLQQLQATLLMQQQQQPSATQLMSMVHQQAHNASAAASLVAVPRIPDNVASVAYFDESGQLLDTLPVCRDFKQSRCQRPNCRYVHLTEDYVEVSSEGKVTVCRDFAKGRCSRVMCKYYHVPIHATAVTTGAVLPTANALTTSSSPFPYLSSSASSPPWSLPASVWLQRFHQQSINSNPTDYLNGGHGIPSVSVSTNSTNDQLSYLLSQQQALLFAQQTALLNSTAGIQKQVNANTVISTSEDAPGSSVSSAALAISGVLHENQPSPATNTGGRKS